ncbi:MAG: hypothetical protein K1X57_05660 [Gemmataceae bacterium]|nr:hypothetical protein [Gemmataceae bacterium]
MEIIELLSVLLDLTCCLLEFIDVIALFTNGISWVKSAPNRAARREAKTVGAEPPPKDFWFQVLVVTTPIALTLTGILVYKWTRLLLGR